MGGWAQMAGSLFRDLGERSTQWLRDSGGEIGGQILDTFRSQRTEFLRGTPQGQKISGMIDQYVQTRNSLLNPLMKPVQELSQFAKDKPDLLTKKLSDLHADFTSQPNHPMTQHTMSLMQDPKNADLTLEGLNNSVRLKASMMARAQIFGPKSELLSDILMPLYNSPDPTMHSHANAMLDIITNALHDNTAVRGAGASRTKLNILDAALLENRQRAAQGVPPLVYDFDKFNTTSIFQHSNQLERLAASRMRRFLAPLIVIPHISTFFNLSWAPLTAMYRSMADMGNQQVEQLVEASGIYTHLLHSMLSEDLENSTGFIANRTKPIYGRIAGNVFHNPGFNYLRKIQLHTAGILGYHSAMYWAEEAVHGDKRAIAELKELGLDAVGIARRGGQLTTEEKQQAVFNFANNRVFIDRLLDRSLTGTRNPWTRMLTYFHGYVTSQQQFMRRELQKMLEAGDYKGIARFAGTVGIVFPAVAPLIKSAEIFGRTASVQKAGASLQEDYDAITSPPSAGAAMGEYLDLMSYFGTWGMFFHMVQSANNDRLALQLMGPAAGSATRIAQDAINYATNPSKAGTRNIRPLAKDVLQQTIPVAGNVIANKLFPKRGE